MEEMQEALRGKHKRREVCMDLCAHAFSTDSLDKRNEDVSSQQDSSTLVSECSSTKTLMNVDCTDCISQRRSFQTVNTWPRTIEKKIYPEIVNSASIDVVHESRISIDDENENENINFVQENFRGFAERNANFMTDHSEKNKKSHKGKYIKSFEASIRCKMTRTLKTKGPSYKRKLQNSKSCEDYSSSSSEENLNVVRRNIPCSLRKRSIASTQKCNLKRKNVKKIMNFTDLPPPNFAHAKETSPMNYSDVESPDSNIHNFYLSPIDEISEASTNSSSYVQTSKKTCIVNKKAIFDIEQSPKKRPTHFQFNPVRKYHTYPKSRIPIPKRFEIHGLKNTGYLLEPREIDLDAYQQLHTADSQEELQEFLLLESQCSGNLGLAENVSTSELSYHEQNSEHERDTMSGIFKLP